MGTNSLDTIENVKEENARLREALKFYAKLENYTYHFKNGDMAPPLIISQDFGKVAREALGEEES